MFKYMFHYKILPITVLLINNIIFFYLRAVYLYIYPEASYIYYKVDTDPLYMLEETIVVYSVLLGLFIIGYLFAISFFKTKNFPIRNQYSINTKYFEYVFYISISILLIRSLFLGEVAGKAPSEYTKYLFFLAWIFPMNLLYTYLILNMKSLIKKVFISLLLVFSIIASGMKAGLILPIIIIFFAYSYKNNQIKLKYFLYIFISIIILLLLFPFVFQIVAEIRLNGHINSLYNVIEDTFRNYNYLIQKIIQYIYYRMSLVEYLQVILQKYNDINRNEVNILTLFVHIYNEFVPSFLEPKTWYLSYSGNKLFPIIFFHMGMDEHSSESLTFGFFVFYFGFLAPIFSFIFGFLFGVIYMKLSNLKNIIFSNLFSVYFLLLFFNVTRGFNIKYMILFIKESISFLLLYYIILFLIKKFPKRRKYANPIMA